MSRGELDGHLSRWLWLVKWVLTIPHFIVLVFLWIAFVVLTVVAFFAILFTGLPARDLRLQRRRDALVLLGTDRYPPFTLADVPDYPARLDVEYPRRSRAVWSSSSGGCWRCRTTSSSVFAGGAWAGFNAANVTGHGPPAAA